REKLDVVRGWNARSADQNEQRFVPPGRVERGEHRESKSGRSPRPGNSIFVDLVVGAPGFLLEPREAAWLEDEGHGGERGSWSLTLPQEPCRRTDEERQREGGKDGSVGRMAWDGVHVWVG